MATPSALPAPQSSGRWGDQCRSQGGGAAVRAQGGEPLAPGSSLHGEPFVEEPMTFPELGRSHGAGLVCEPWGLSVPFPET